MQQALEGHAGDSPILRPKAGEPHSRFRSDFAVLEQLGRGGFGRVWRARNRYADYHP